MTVTCGFYNSVNNDRRYNALQMSSIFDGIITDGIFMSIGDNLIVSAATGMQVSVGSGRAWFNHTWTNNDSPILLDVPASEVVLNRIDAVVLEINKNEEVRENIIKIIEGTARSSPVAPTLVNTEFINQYPLAYIFVGADVSSISAVNITNKVGTSECPFITGILESINADSLLTQWEAEFDEWFATVQDTLSGDTAGNLLNLINEKITTGTSTIPTTGWVENSGDDALKLDLSIANVEASYWVDITIDKDYQDIALEAEINPTITEYDGGITFYANTAPTVPIPIRYKVVR